MQSCSILTGTSAYRARLFRVRLREYFGHPARCSGCMTRTIHWPEYLMEAAALGLFMISACAFTLLLEHPGSPARHLLPAAMLRRVYMGIAMGLTAVAIIYSPW